MTEMESVKNAQRKEEDDLSNTAKQSSRKYDIMIGVKERRNMPRLMEKKDWMQTVAEVGSAENVWYENVSADGSLFPLSMPESGMYRVILVKIDKPCQTTVGKSPVRIGSKKGVWRIPTEEEDRAMDEEIAASFDLDGAI